MSNSGIDPAIIVCMKAKVAIPLYNDRVSPLFDVSRRFIIFQVESGVVSDSYHLDTSADSGIQKVNRLKREYTEMIICSAISRVLADLITSKGMELIPGVIGNVSDVIQAYVSNALVIDRFTMPGCRWRRRVRRGQCPRYRDIVNWMEYERREE